jgi:lycopene cyclase domain-containing protein
MWLYLLSLLVASGCLLIIDHRFKLAFWYNAKRTSLTLGICVVLFIIWDILGISFNIFFDGSSPYMLPVRLLPHFPLEELFFLFLLVYVTLIVYRGAGMRWPRI